MDGFKKRLRESVQFKLSFSLSIVIFVVAAITGTLSFLSAVDEAHELQDDVLRQVAQLVDRRHLQTATPLSDRASRGYDADEGSRVMVQVLSDGGASKAVSDQKELLFLPSVLSEGLQTLDVDGESFRVLVRTTATGDRIAVSQASAFRNEIARESALRTALPVLVLMPAVLLVISNLVRKMFRPIALLAEELDERREQELHPVDDTHLPIEVRPFASAINRLLARIDKTINMQRRFVADAAHELRSPLTAMSLQAERLSQVRMPAEASERLKALRLGIERGRNLLEQLLALAKAQSTGDSPESPVSVQAILRHVVEDLMPLAEAKGIDIGMEGTEDALVFVSDLDMSALIKNLVDNAIRYTPTGGRVDLAVNTVGSYAVLLIQDNGPGIELEERNRVFDPFYRTLGSGQSGSGLGLSIVDTIIRRIGAQIRLGYADLIQGTGLRVEVIIRLGRSPETPSI